VKTPRDLTAAGLERGVLKAIRDRVLLRPGSVVVAAVSGGADSLCLLHVLARLADKLGVRLQVAHLDHMLRGAASRDDADFVAAQARALGLPCIVEARDVASWRRRRRCSMEEAAREVRYLFLHEVACSVGADAVATGHTRDDAVETLLLHVIRGSGLRGLRGLESDAPLPVRGGPDGAKAAVRIVRPLLHLSRDQTRAYCRLLGLTAREDASNESLSHLRNRVRLQLLPRCRELNPRFEHALLRLGRAAASDDAHLEEECSNVYASIAHVQPGCVRLDVEGFSAASSAIQSRLVRRAHEQVAGDVRDVSMEHVCAVRRLAETQAGKHLCLVSGVTWSRETSDLVAFGRAHAPAGGGVKAPLNPVEIPVPGEVFISGWRVTTIFVDGPTGNLADDRFTAALDADNCGSRLFVRRRQPGDRFRPLGMAGTKKLQDFMVDAGISLAERDSVPLLCSQEQIAWVVGWRVDDRVKVTRATRRVLMVTFLPLV